MSTPQPDAQEVQRYIELLYPDPPLDAWLVISWLTPASEWQSQWFKAASLDKAPQWIARKAQQDKVYIPPTPSSILTMRQTEGR
jgi:hypothetical protein